MISAASVKNRLANKAKASGKTMQELLIMYCLERTLYRLSISKYSDKFTLKWESLELKDLLIEK